MASFASPYRFSRKRRSRLLREVEALAAERFKAAAAVRLERDSALVERLDGRRLDPYQVAAELVDELTGGD